MVDILRSRERAISQYSRARSNGKNDIGSAHRNVGNATNNHYFNTSKNFGSHSHTNVKNQRRSLAEKSNIVL